LFRNFIGIYPFPNDGIRSVKNRVSPVGARERQGFICKAIVAKQDILYRDGGNMCGSCDRKRPPAKSGRQPDEGQRQALPCLHRKTDGNN